ncbi:hypothetical protein CMEL01_02108 [Colletotrichum melonis]|uniref:Uncharacterized protein n=1 Tax=Colletotrichum melonis TaxID=1209925 RepID=A0AAI9UIN2_9PEZI|nr:hypothetical protein CMEL01_02108 [Colletotrichum melonis]
MLAHTELLVSTQLILTGSERAASVQRLQQPSVLMPEVVIDCTIRCITVISGQTRAWRGRNTSERGTDIGCLLPAAHAICIHSELLPTQLENAVSVGTLDCVGCCLMQLSDVHTPPGVIVDSWLSLAGLPWDRRILRKLADNARAAAERTRPSIFAAQFHLASTKWYSAPLLPPLSLHFPFLHNSFADELCFCTPSLYPAIHTPRSCPQTLSSEHNCRL